MKQSQRLINFFSSSRRADGSAVFLLVVVFLQLFFLHSFFFHNKKNAHNMSAPRLHIVNLVIRVNRDVPDKKNKGL